MVKKNIKYVDFNGNEVEETVYFNLSKAEMTMKELEVKGGMSNLIKEAVESGDNAKLVHLFHDIILDSYGVKSEDGKRFVKSEKLREEFAQSAAFSEIFMELATDGNAAEAFIKAIQQ